MSTEQAARSKKAPKITRIKNAKPDPKAAKGDAIKAAAKENAEKEKALKVAKAEKALAPLPKEINHRLDQSKLLGAKAIDHRVSAAIRMGEAKAICDEAGINFKVWAEKNIPNQSYETIRKLASAGASGDEAEVRLQIADMREKNAEANKNLRKKKAARSIPEKNIGKDPESGGSSRAATPFQQVEAGLSKMNETEVRAIIGSQASEFGLQLVPDKELKKLREAAESGSGAAPVRKKGEPVWKPLLDSVMALTGKDRADFMFELGEATGYKFMDKATYVKAQKLLHEADIAEAGKAPAHKK